MERVLQVVERVLDAVASGIELLGVAVLAAGIGVGLVRLLPLAWSPALRRRAVGHLTLYRRELGAYVLLGLEILIVADVIHTVIRRTREDVIVLVAIVAIRTTIAFFLERELRFAASLEAAEAESREC